MIHLEVPYFQTNPNDLFSLDPLDPCACIHRININSIVSSAKNQLTYRFGDHFCKDFVVFTRFIHRNVRWNQLEFGMSEFGTYVVAYLVVQDYDDEIDCYDFMFG